MFLSLVLLIFLAVFFVSISAADEICRDGLMIYEVYGDGGNVGAIYNSDYVVLYNSTEREIPLEGWLLQYASSDGIFTSEEATPLSNVLSANSYYLIRQGSIGSRGADLPNVDKKGSLKANLAAEKGKIALVHSQAVVNSENIELFDDFISYNNKNKTKSIYRKNSKCLDTNNDALDFEAHIPTPKNSFTVEDENEKENKIPICVDKITLSEIFPFSGEFVEVESEAKEKCDLAGWGISDQTNGKYLFSVGSIIEPGKQFAFFKDFGLNSSSTDGAKLFNSNSVLVDERFYPKPDTENVSFSRGGENEWNWTIKTPNEKNIFQKEVDEEKNYSNKITINELLPAPLKDSGQEEFVELYISGDEAENLDGWYLKDRAGKICMLAGNVINPLISRFLVLKNDADKKCVLALNDTQGETLGLYNPIDKDPVSSVSYEGSAKKGLSYGFDGSRWRWSKFLTPGNENIFNNEPYGKLKNDKNVYAKVYANFSVSIGDKDGDKVKVVWDFGDGHKSYLTKTRHKYEKVGKYSVSVKLSDGSEDVLKEFGVEVKKFPHPKVSIVAINANPKGKDSEFETLTIKNNLKNKINLEGWSIATGTKKLANHPIRKKLVLKKGKTQEITRQVSSFSLNNKKAKIELRYPDGKVASKLKYDHGKISIAEDEIYEKVKGGWVWKKATSNQGTKDNIQNSIDNSQESINSEQESTEEMRKAVDGEWEVEKKGVGLLLRESNFQEDELVSIKLLKNQPTVLGAETVREEGGQYLFTPQIEQKHYLVSFWEKLFASLNAGMNQVMNYFFK
ncbi:MAG: PKD domain-containing protein [Candidatus Moranbacteria bacterium]|nr:PKD domain-containing protein [Candidatus Moranbacteria bacterium]